MKPSFQSFIVATALTLLAACGGGAPAPAPGASAAPAAGDGGQINGAGATFPYPIYSKWFADYNKQRPDVKINYQSIGSGGGIRQLSARTVFFGASDGPMTDEQLAAAGRPILHFPTVLGAVVPIYNLAGNPDLKFTGPVLAQIFAGTVKKWNDPALTALNPGAKLPAADITVVHRSDGSGTTFIFTDYLSKVSPEWKQKVGASTAVGWPVGVGGKGNEGVAGLVQQTPNAIGYTELVYALQNKIAYGSVRNKDGADVKATTDSVTAAAAGAAIPADFRVSITDAPGKGAYPLSSFTWILLEQKPADKAKARQMVDFMRWALTDGQKSSAALGYAPLPAPVVTQELAALAKVEAQ